MSTRIMLVGLVLAACAPNADLPSGPGKSPGRPEAGPPPVSNNTPPAVTITTPAAGATIVVGDPIPLTASFTDVDLNDTHTCSIDWQVSAAPGTVSESAGAGTCAGSFAYGLEGTYTVQVSVIDNMGGMTTASINVTVAPAPPPPPPPAPPPPSTSGLLRGAGALTLVTPAATKKEHRWPRVWFQVNGRFNRDSNQPRGEVAVDLPGTELRFVGQTIDAFAVQGARADLRGTGRVGRRGGSYSFLVTAIDGGWPGRHDRIRIKIWDGSGTLLDTDPGLADTADPTHTLDLGRIIVHQ